MTIRKVKLYTDLDYQAGTGDRALVPIIWAQLDKVSQEERISKHHARATHFDLVSHVGQADWCVLPSVWNAYIKQGTVHRAIKFSSDAANKGKLVIVWSAGDPEWIIPIDNAVQVQEGLHSGLSRRVAYVFERPGFVTDYIRLFRDGNWHPLPKREKPIVGFCGLAKSRLRSRIHFYTRNSMDLVKYRLNISPVVPVLHGYPTDLRVKVLRVLEKHPNIETNFIVRDLYLAGVRTKDQLRKLHDQTRIEFVNNVFDSMYTVCVRGGGNFSKRFYETLACGRIPILVSTDSVLPFEEFIDWNNYIVRVEHNELDILGEKLCDFHGRLSSSEFEELQAECRKLWLQMLNPQGYYSNFYRYLSITNNEVL